MTNEERAQKFYEALRKLEEEHGIEIWDESCGCCGYTHLVDKVSREAITEFFEG